MTLIQCSRQTALAIAAVSAALFRHAGFVVVSSPGPRLRGRAEGTRDVHPPMLSSAASDARQLSAAAAVAVVGIVMLSRQRPRSVTVACSASRRDAAAIATSSVVLGIGPLNASAKSNQYPVLGTEDIMAKKAHGTSPHAVQESLRWNCNRQKADEICSFNRDFAEYAGYWQETSFISELRDRKQKEQGEPETVFYDSVTGKPLFTAPRNRAVKDFLRESLVHGWPSFRDEEVNWEYVRCLPDGECVSIDGTHLGHNIPDGSGNRYCINLVSVAGKPI